MGAEPSPAMSSADVVEVASACTRAAAAETALGERWLDRVCVVCPTASAPPRPPPTLPALGMGRVGEGGESDGDGDAVVAVVAVGVGVGVSVSAGVGVPAAGDGTWMWGSGSAQVLRTSLARTEEAVGEGADVII